MTRADAALPKRPKSAASASVPSFCPSRAPANIFNVTSSTADSNYFPLCPQPTGDAPRHAPWVVLPCPFSRSSTRNLNRNVQDVAPGHKRERNIAHKRLSRHSLPEQIRLIQSSLIGSCHSGCAGRPPPAPPGLDPEPSRRTNTRIPHRLPAVPFVKLHTAVLYLVITP